MNTLNKEIDICVLTLKAWEYTTIEEEREVIYRLNMLRKIKKEFAEWSSSYCT